MGDRTTGEWRIDKQHGDIVIYVVNVGLSYSFNCGLVTVMHMLQSLGRYALKWPTA